MPSTNRTRRSFLRLATVMALVAVLTAASGPARPVGADPAGTLTLTPSSGLVDGQMASIDADLAPGFYGIVPCPAGATSAEECGSGLILFESDGEGPLSWSVRVYARVDMGGGSVDCRPLGACELVVVDHADPSGLLSGVRVPFGFDPDGALLPAPVVSVDPDQDLIDGQAVTITASGLEVDRVVSAQQCATGPVDRTCRGLGFAFSDDAGAAVWSTALRARLGVALDGSDPGLDCRDVTVTCVVEVRTFAGPQPDPVPIAFDPDGPLMAPPEFEVVPASEIADGRSVTVRGTNMLAGEEIRVRLCPADSAGDCDPTVDAWAGVGVDGIVEVEVVLYGTYDHYTGSVDCRRSPGCELRVDRLTSGETVRLPVSFAPAPPSRGRYLDPVFDDVEVIHDVVYRTTVDSRGQTVDLRLDLYQPAGDTATQRPALIWFHGGFFVFGDRSEMEPYAMASARRGYVGVLVSYRLRPEASTNDLVGLIPAAEDALEDATAAVRWLEDNATIHRIDPDAIFAGGVSAGAVLAWNLNVVPDAPVVDASVPISGLALAGPTAGDAPIIAFHATDDSILPYGPHEASCSAAVAVGVVCEWVGYTSGGHYIARSHYRDIVNRTHTFLFDRILAPAGYTNDPPTPGPVDPPVDPPGPEEPNPTVPPGPTPAPGPAGPTSPPGEEPGSPAPPNGLGPEPTRPAPSPPGSDAAPAARPRSAYPSFTG